MEYIYCKDREEYKYTMRVLKRAGYEREIDRYVNDWIMREHFREDIADRRGITLYVSDEKRTINKRAVAGFQPKNCKPSKIMGCTDDKGVFHRINKPCVSEVWKDLNKFMATKPNTDPKTNLEPLDDTEELKADREKLRKFAKDTKGKAKITLAPMQILKDIAEVREYGVKKYGSVDSWKEVPIEDYRDALFRHLLEYIKDPNSVDNESGIKHYKHIACNLAFICEMENMEDGTRSI